MQDVDFFPNFLQTVQSLLPRRIRAFSRGVPPLSHNSHTSLRRMHEVQQLQIVYLRIQYDDAATRE